MNQKARRGAISAIGLAVVVATAAWMWPTLGQNEQARAVSRLADRLPKGGTVTVRQSFADCPEALARTWLAPLTKGLGGEPVAADRSGLDDEAMLAVAAGRKATTTGKGVVVGGACIEDKLHLVLVDLATGSPLGAHSVPLLHPRRGTGQMLLTSRPSGAAVKLDGREAGTTPLVVTAAVGAHALRLADARFLPVDEAIEVRAGVNPQRRYEMKAGEGHLAVVTHPAKAELWVDGTKLADTSPALLGPLPAGAHQVEARGSGGAVVRSAVSVPTDETARIELKFPGADEEPATWREPRTGIEMVRVPSGCFRMGCGPWSNECDPDEKAQHDICLDPFWMGRTEVTAGQWQAVMGRLPDGLDVTPEKAVGRVSWEEAQAFVARLNAIADGGFRLPTEAEWEYACRSGGKAEKFPGGTEQAERHSGTDFIQLYGWVGHGRYDGPFPVGAKTPNGLGLHDMAGNVWEWTADTFALHAYQVHATKNPVYQDEAGPAKVIRGGSWLNYTRLARCGHRDRRAPDYHSDDVGLRLVRTP